MNCFTLTPKNKILPYIDFRNFRWCQKFKNPEHVEKAALRLYSETDWSYTDVVNSMRFHDNNEALLYNVAYFVEGDSRSALLPDDSFLLATPMDSCKRCSEIQEEWTMPVVFNEDSVIYLCYEGKTFLELGKSGYITNIKGEPVIQGTIDKPLEPPDGIIWEF